MQLLLLNYVDCSTAWWFISRFTNLFSFCYDRRKDTDRSLGWWLGKILPVVTACLWCQGSCNISNFPTLNSHTKYTKISRYTVSWSKVQLSLFCKLSISKGGAGAPVAPHLATPLFSPFVLFAVSLIFMLTAYSDSAVRETPNLLSFIHVGIPLNSRPGLPALH